MYLQRRTVPVLCLTTLVLAFGACAAMHPARDPEVGATVDAIDARRAAGAVLDDWHAAASAADEARYMGHFAQDAVFLGTDASERWERASFGEYVHSYFSQGRGWTYLPGERHIELSDDGKLAWFDEALANEGYGELRGTGVLVRVAGAWKIQHYNLTFTVPNDVASEVVRVIRAGPE